MQNITRRGFVGTAAAMGVAAATVGSVAAASEAAKPAGLGTYAEGAPADLDWQGTPAELMARGGLYRRMVELQSQSAQWQLNQA